MALAEEAGGDDGRECVLALTGGVLVVLRLRGGRSTPLRELLRDIRSSSFCATSFSLVVTSTGLDEAISKGSGEKYVDLLSSAKRTGSGHFGGGERGPNIT